MQPCKSKTPQGILISDCLAQLLIKNIDGWMDGCGVRQITKKKKPYFIQDAVEETLSLM